MYEIALATSVLCFAGVTVAFARHPAFSVFHPLAFYLAFHGLVFVFRPVVAHVLDFRLIYRVYEFTPSASDKLTALMAANVGMLAFAAAALHTGGTPMRFGQGRQIAAERVRLIPALLAMLVIVIPPAIYSLMLKWDFAANASGTMVMDSGTGIFMNTTTNGYLTDAQLMLASALALLAWIFRFRPLAVAPMALFVLVKAGTGGRGAFVSALVCLGLLWLYERRYRVPGWRMLAGGVALVAVFAAVGDDRGRAVRQWLGGDNTLAGPGPQVELRFLEGMDYGNLEMVEFLVYAVPQRTGTHEFLADHLMLFTEPVPRVLWPDKPRGSPVKLFELFDYGYPIGMTRSLPGEGWVAFGWLGVIGWCAAWGLALGAIYRRFAAGRQGPFAVAGYMLLLGMLVVGYRDGTVITMLRGGLFYAFPILVWYAIAWFTGALPRVATAPANPVDFCRIPPAVARRRAKMGEQGRLP